MKNLNLLTLLLLLLGISSCTKEPKIDCIDSMLESYDMIAQTSLSPEGHCKFFLELYHFRGKQYFSLGNHCVSMVIFYNDCDGEILCDGENDFKCNRFLDSATRIGIVGVEE